MNNNLWLARVVFGGTDKTFPIDEFIEHEIEAEPGRYMLVFCRPGKSAWSKDSCKDLRIYFMNNEGKTIDRREYRK